MADIVIGGRLHSAATGNTVAGANEIMDDAQGKKQSVVNQETNERFNAYDTAILGRYTNEEINNLISNTPETDVIVVDIPAASQSDISSWLDANTPSGTDPETGRSVRANKLYRVPGPDNTTYSEWAWDGTAYIMLANKDYGFDDEPTPESRNLINSGAVASNLGYNIDNVEFVRVVVDSQNRVVFGIQRDGNVVFGAGVPKQIIDLVNNNLEGIKTFLGNGPLAYKKISIIGDSISTFADYIPNGYPTWYPHIGDRSSDVISIDDTWWKKLIDDTGSSLEVNASASGSTASSNYIGFSPRVSMLGNPDVIFVALGTNDSGREVPVGNIDFNTESYDLTQFAPAYIKGIKDTMSEYPNARIICLAFDMGVEYQNVIKTISEHYSLDYIYVGDISDVHPNKAEMQAVFERIRDTYTLEVLLNGKVDKKYLEENYGKYEESPEFFEVKLDANGDILWGIRKNGDIVFGCGIPSEIQNALNKIAKDIDDNFGDIRNTFHYVSNSEYLVACVDGEDKFLYGVTVEGKFRAADLEFELPEEEAKWLNTVFSLLEDPEHRLEATLDGEDKVLSWRDSEGVKHETNLAIEHSLELSSEAMTAFQQALKDSGFNPGSGGDYSDKEVVEIPFTQSYAILNLKINGAPKYDTEIKSGYAEYYDGLGNYFKKAVKIETQGQSSRNFSRTDNRGNFTLDIDDGSEIKFGSWVPQDSFHLKGTPKDVTHGILATSYKWAYMFMEYLDAKPNRVLLKDSSKITTTNASGDRFTDWINDARCLPDGFPVEIYVDDEYWGLYAWQLKKHRKNYSMNKKDYTSLFIDADNLLDSDWQHGFWLDGVDSTPAGTNKKWWDYIDIKGPKDLVCMDGSAFDGDNPMELIDNTSPVYDSSNKKHKGSAQAKAIIRGFSTKYLEVKELVDNNNIEGAKAKFNENFDYNACMLVYIFNCLMNNGDSVKKNTLWGTWKDGKIAPMLWDIDGVYGTDWWGGTCNAPNAGMWTGVYATSGWPLSFMWTLYQDEIKATYAELRSHGIIDMNTWRSVVFGWAKQIGTEAFDRDIERWPEMPSYRENYTNTEYWQEYGSSSTRSSYSTWDENTSYSIGDIVVIKIHPEVGWYLRYRAIKASDAQNPQSPVTKLYDACPQVGGYYDSPRRMEKWMEEQIRLCDIVMEYNQ